MNSFFHPPVAGDRQGHVEIDFQHREPSHPLESITEVEQGSSATTSEKTEN